MNLSRSGITLVAALFLMLGGCAGLDMQSGSSSPSTSDQSPKALAGLNNKQSRQGDAVDSISDNGGRPELDAPGVDLTNLSGEDTFPLHGVEQAVVTDDLWQRLRDGFRLSNLETSPERVAYFEKWYAKHPVYFERLADRAYWFLPYVLDQVEKRGMPAEVAILPAIESAFRPDATSRSRAAGMWQFLSSTGRRFGLRQDWWMDGRRDLVQSTRAALDYLEYLSQEFDGDWELALASYNAGEGTIGRAVRKNHKNNKPASYADLKLRQETSEYIPRLFAVRNILKQPEKFGIALKPLGTTPTLKVVDLKTQTDISVAASFLSLSRKELHFLNMGYTRGVTPPNGPHILVVPADEADQLVIELASLSPTQRMQWAHHKVKKGDVLGKIAATHGVTVKSIQLANSLSGTTIRPGQELRIPLSTGPVQFAGPVLNSEDGNPRKHLVARGDTLWEIAQRYGVKLSSLLHINQISKKTTLYPGQSLIVSQ